MNDSNELKRRQSTAKPRQSNKRKVVSIGSIISSLAIIALVAFVNYCTPSTPATPGAPPTLIAAPPTSSVDPTASAPPTNAPATSAPATTAPTVPPRAPTPTRAPAADAPLTALPDMPNKPRPQQITFKGCPPDGDGGDRELNRLKNRVDEGNYVPVTFDAIMNLKWPKTIETRDRSRWSAADKAAIARYEGIPIMVEGYWAGARLSGPESSNCHGEDEEFRDHHIWLTQKPNDDRRRSIVVEPTPRVKAKHPAWNSDVFTRVVRDQLLTRVSGWLMMDPEHPSEINKTRGTIWEIHPVTQIEIRVSGRWVPLDDFAR